MKQLENFLEQALGKKYDRDEVQVHRWQRSVIIRKPNYFKKISECAHKKEFQENIYGGLYFEYSFTRSELDRWNFELVEKVESFLSKYGKRYEIKKFKINPLIKKREDYKESGPHSLAENLHFQQSTKGDFVSFL